MHATQSEARIQQRIAAALHGGATTREVVVGTGVVGAVGECVRRWFDNQPVVVVADTNTFAAAGEQIHDQLCRFARKVVDPFVFDQKDLYAEYGFASELRSMLTESGAIALAIGSGTINDLAKLASGECGRPYLAVATAASMDGYTSFGASVTRDGYKQTLPCPAPLAVVVDLDILAAAPSRLNAAGYADLLAKIPAGADWLVADALGIEPIDTTAWSLVQKRLREWVSDPAAIRRGDRAALAGLVEGLLMTGLAMQHTGTTRPASGAEHQFSHLWDMQHYLADSPTQDALHNGWPMHGEKVAIGTITSLSIYERAMAMTADDIAVDRQCIGSRWPTWNEVELATRTCFSDPHLANQVIEQQRGKYIGPKELIQRLAHLRDCWPALRDRLRGQLVPAEQLRQWLAEAGAPHQSDQIGVSCERLHESCRLAQRIRNRYTVLDLVYEGGWWDACVDGLFSSSVASVQAHAHARAVHSSGGRADCTAALSGVKLIALDMDGTVYKGNTLFPWTKPFLALLDKLGIKYSFITNNCSRSARDYLVHLRSLGLEANADQVFTSGLATIEYLRGNHAAVDRLLLLGTGSLEEEFREAGFTIIDPGGPEPQMVVVGFDTGLTYDRLCTAAYWIKQGKPYIATHPDMICPTDQPTVLVDCGAVCSCLEKATGRIPDGVVGKPNPRMLAGILSRHNLKPAQLAMVGDRIYTDIAMAQAAGVLSVLVLSGEATAADAADCSTPPDLVVENLSGLGELLRDVATNRRNAVRSTA